MARPSTKTAKFQDGLTETTRDDLLRDSILEVALRLLEAHGYAAVTTDAIAAEASVSKATLYRLWRTKQQIVVDAAQIRFQSLEVPDLGSFEEEVKWVLAHRLQDYRQPGMRRLVGGLIGAASTDHELAKVFEGWVDHLGRAIRLIIQRGIARGDVRESVDGQALETMIAGVVARAVVSQQVISDATVDEIASLIGAAASLRLDM